MLLIATHSDDQSPPRTSLYYCSPETVAQMLKQMTSGYHGKLEMAASDPMMDDEPHEHSSATLRSHKATMKKESQGGALYSPPVPCPLRAK